MTPFDTNVPERLKHLQEWFATVITTPIDHESRICRTAPNGHPIELEASQYITPSLTLKPHQRIEIYNQQYWWRLLNVLHTTFPFLTRLLGFEAFNALIAEPYLCKYPSNHWSIDFVGNRLVRWIEEAYPHEDKVLITAAAEIDWAYQASFFAPTTPSLQNARLDQPLYLQEHVSLYQRGDHLFAFRDALLEKEVAYWQTHPFPEIDTEKDYHFILYRDKDLNITWKQIPEEAFQLLQQFQKGISLEKMCTELEESPSSSSKKISNHLHTWLQEWVVMGWLTYKKPSV